MHTNLALLAGPALQLTGSTTLLPHMQRIVEAYLDTHAASIVINGGCGTARGYKALLDGTTDIAMASGAASAGQAAAATARGLPLRATVITQDAILPLVHATNPLTTLSLLELANIFTGRIDNWRDVGGADAAIEVLVGPPSGGVSGSWRQRVLGDDDTYTPHARVLDFDSRLARLAVRQHAITYIPQMVLPTRHVKGLRIDGLDAGAARYPLRAPMMLVTLGAPAPAMAAFIASAAAPRHG